MLPTEGVWKYPYFLLESLKMVHSEPLLRVWKLPPHTRRVWGCFPPLEGEHGSSGVGLGMFITKIKLNQESIPPLERQNFVRSLLIELQKTTPEGGEMPELIGKPTDSHVRWKMTTPDVGDDKMLAFSYTVSTLRAAVHGASDRAETPGWPTEAQIRSQEWNHQDASHGLRIIWRPSVG